MRHVDTPWPLVGGDALVIVPLGSCEQHGPHLPLDTDSVIVEAIADRVAGELIRSGIPCRVAPVLAYGASGEHQAFAGTLSLGTDALQLVLTELIRSASTWASRILLLNGHGGNSDALRMVVRQMRDEGHMVAWASCTVPGGDAHAGHTETSMLLALVPQRVGDFDQVEGNTTAIDVLLPDLRTHGVIGVSANGVLGDPRSADAGDGQLAIERCSMNLVQAVGDWSTDAAGMLVTADRTQPDSPRS